MPKLRRFSFFEVQFSVKTWHGLPLDSCRPAGNLTWKPIYRGRGCKHATITRDIKSDYLVIPLMLVWSKNQNQFFEVETKNTPKLQQLPPNDYLRRIKQAVELNHFIIFHHQNCELWDLFIFQCKTYLLSWILAKIVILFEIRFWLNWKFCRE